MSLLEKTDDWLVDVEVEIPENKSGTSSDDSDSSDEEEDNEDDEKWLEGKSPMRDGNNKPVVSPKKKKYAVTKRVKPAPSLDKSDNNDDSSEKDEFVEMDDSDSDSSSSSSSDSESSDEAANNKPDILSDEVKLQVLEDLDVELLSVVSEKDLETIPPPIEIPDALRPWHERIAMAKGEKAVERLSLAQQLSTRRMVLDIAHDKQRQGPATATAKKKKSYLDDSSSDDGSSSFTGSDLDLTPSLHLNKPAPAALAPPPLPMAHKPSYLLDDSDSDSSSTDSEEERRRRRQKFAKNNKPELPPAAAAKVENAESVLKPDPEVTEPVKEEPPKQEKESEDQVEIPKSEERETVDEVGKDVAVENLIMQKMEDKKRELQRQSESTESRDTDPMMRPEHRPERMRGSSFISTGSEEPDAPKRGGRRSGATEGPAKEKKDVVPEPDHHPDRSGDHSMVSHDSDVPDFVGRGGKPPTGTDGGVDEKEEKSKGTTEDSTLTEEKPNLEVAPTTSDETEVPQQQEPNNPTRSIGKLLAKAEDPEEPTPADKTNFPQPELDNPTRSIGRLLAKDNDTDVLETSRQSEPENPTQSVKELFTKDNDTVVPAPEVTEPPRPELQKPTRSIRKLLASADDVDEPASSEETKAPPPEPKKPSRSIGKLLASTDDAAGEEQNANLVGAGRRWKRPEPTSDGISGQIVESHDSSSSVPTSNVDDDQKPPRNIGKLLAAVEEPQEKAEQQSPVVATKKWTPPPKEEAEQAPEPAPVATASGEDDDKDDPNGEYYTLKELRAKSVPGLDYANREKYLRAADFKKVLGCNRLEFSTWPKWKQTKVKRQAKLF